MKLGIVGPPQAGKTTLFTVLTGQQPGPDALAGRTVSKMVSVPDPRLERLREIFEPRSFKPAMFQAVDFGAAVSAAAREGEERTADAFLVVLPLYAGLDPAEALEELDLEWTLLDLGIVEKRIERLEKAVVKPTPHREQDEKELARMRRLAAALGEQRPLRELALDDEERLALRPYGFHTLKPRLVIHNVDEQALPYPDTEPEAVVTVCGSLEAELAVLPPEDQADMREGFGIEEPARPRLIRAAYRLLGLISFFTVGPDEVRAWTIPAGTPAPVAAGAIHSDLQRGFIRAEVTAYDDFIAAGGSLKAAKAANVTRLEGKDYIVQDGDILEIRFSV
ncbi:MAG: redox-regulated ATPase YchF [Planctomycetota bacterium]|nr:MAG: redox-regulated ATPase YchF [Planctomycetota bacterium]